MKHRGEVWWVRFDPSVGSEIRKTRPAIVVSNDRANRVLTRFQVVPLSSQVDKVYPGETLVSVLGRRSKAMADQIATISQDRLTGKIGSLSERDMRAVERVIGIQLALKLEEE